jgi:two-component system cell cycle sensor histidine kinase/response regulator CckA
MNRPLHILLIEDSPDDALLIQLELKRGGYSIESRRVQTEAELREALAQGPWDLVVSDFTLPGFDALGALRVVQQVGLDVPFLVVSGTIGEETAVGVLKAGAHDFVLKDRLARFLPAVERELREVTIRAQRRAAEAALRDSEQTHRRIVETAQEGIWQLDLEGRTTFANQRMAQMLASTPEQMSGRLVTDFLVEPPLLLQTRGHPMEGQPMEIELRRVDGGRFWGSVSVSAVIEERRGRIGTLVMVADVTQRRQMQSQLLTSDRLASIGLLAAGVAHEINNPLSAVVGNLSLAAEAARESDPLHSLLRDALEAADRVRQIAQDLKLFARADEEERVPVDVHEAIASALRLAQAEVRHRARIDCDLRPVPRVLATEARLGQVLLNLIVNAAQAIPQSSAREHRIHISARKGERGSVIIEVSDTGVGMTPEIMSHLFVPFFTTKPRGVGTGLGLSICQRIVASLGGKISASSTPGAGSTFRLELPATQMTPWAPMPAPPRPPAHRQFRVLIVDDEPLIGTVLERILQEHEVIVTQTADEALGQLDSGLEFDAILCELMMPQKTGMELYEHVARRSPTRARRFVFTTAGAITQQARAFLDQVGAPCLNKPFDAAEIRAVVASLQPMLLSG